ncbi:MAG TPA: aspartate--tRNA(Asn) ligase [Candidatus Paceibacterota bacterium]
MERIYIDELKKHVGKTVTIAGWVDVRRDHGKLIFLDLRDKSGKVQMVALPNHTEAHALAHKLRSEWVIAVTGNVNERPAKMVNADDVNGSIEIEITEIAILSEAEELPFALDGELNLDTLLDHRPLTLRRSREQDIFKVQEVIAKTYRSSLSKQGFTEFQAPALVGEDAEGGANVFKVSYFNEKDAYLATSPQFYKQIMVGVYERAFTITKVFRAEKHSTSRHLNEYSSLDAEMGFIVDHQSIMKVLTDVLKEVATVLTEEHAQTFEKMGVTFPKLPDEIPHMKLREAQQLIKHETGENCTHEPDLEPEHERWLCTYAKEKLESDFIFITHYPVSKRPFYTYEDEEDPGFTKSFDLLFRGLEIATGGQRVHDYKMLIEKLNGRGLNPDMFSFYLEAFKYGMPPHGGWGMGLERLTARFLNLDNVREAALFPRDINRIDTLLSQ